jgi:hypothetical protein
MKTLINEKRLRLFRLAGWYTCLAEIAILKNSSLINAPLMTSANPALTAQVLKNCENAQVWIKKSQRILENIKFD